MDINAFKAQLAREDGSHLTWQYLTRPDVHAFPTPADYNRFQKSVASILGKDCSVLLAGSGNWKFSLSPTKLFNEFSPASDMDVVVLSWHHFSTTWQIMRNDHRARWMTLTLEERSQLARFGQNVYAGFVTPLWIPWRLTQKMHPARYQHTALLNKLRDFAPGQRKVNLLFFRNELEVHDYYLRGFRIAQRRIIQP